MLLSEDLYYDIISDTVLQLANFVNSMISDEIKKMLDVPKGTLGIWLVNAKGIIKKDVDSKYSDLKDKIQPIYDFLKKDMNKIIEYTYEKALAESGEAKAKELVTILKNFISFLDSFMSTGSITQALIDAYRSAVQKWLIWYIPILPFPVAHWYTYRDSKTYLLPEATMPLAYAQYWMDFDLNIPTPSSYVHAGQKNIELPEQYIEQWEKIYQWYNTQEFMYDINVSSDIKSVIIEEIIAITLDIYSKNMVQGKKNDSASDIEKNNELERRLNTEAKEIIFKKTGSNAFLEFKVQLRKII